MNMVPGGGRIGAAAKTGGGGGMAKIDLIHTFLGILKGRNIRKDVISSFLCTNLTGSKMADFPGGEFLRKS